MPLVNRVAQLLKQIFEYHRRHTKYSIFSKQFNIDFSKVNFKPTVNIGATLSSDKYPREHFFTPVNYPPSAKVFVAVRHKLRRARKGFPANLIPRIV